MSFRARPCADLAEYGLAILGVGQYFGLEVDAEAEERFTSLLPLDRMHAAFEGSDIVGGAGAFPFELSTPGGSVRTAGVTVVGTYPTHRRRGVLRAREAGKPTTSLLPVGKDCITVKFSAGVVTGPL